MAKRIGGLGKGLGTIFTENKTEDKNEVVSLKISQIEPNRNQPRKDFDIEALGELADSIKQHGVIQPIIVRPLITGGYQIVAGERRFRATRMAGITEIPAIIREMDDSETMQLAMIENLQRENLSPIEEALGYDMLYRKYNLNQDAIARAVGKSRSAVTNSMRLLGLPTEVREMVSAGDLSAGHARALLSIEDTDELKSAAQKVKDGGLSVRDTEKLVKRYTEKDVKPHKQSESKKFFKEVELSLAEHLGTKVRITEGKVKDSGTLSIEFYDLKDLTNLAARLGKPSDIENFI